MKVHMTPLPFEIERTILEEEAIIHNLDAIRPVCTINQILQIRSLVNHIHVEDTIKDAIVQILQTTRSADQITLGASTRAGIMLLRALKAFALVSKRSYVTEDDVVYLTPLVLQHRLKFRENIRDKSRTFQRILEPVFETLIRKV
jgi:MoxR-like ATPase